jgi:hypothetical protein
MTAPVTPIRPAAVPSLDQLARDPGQAASLPAAVRGSLLAQALAVVGALAAPVLTQSPAPCENRILGVPEVAHRMNVSRDYVYRHASEWPFTVRRGRKLGFSGVGLIAYLHRQSGSGS